MAVEIHIFLHGFFFAEVQQIPGTPKNKLVIASPKHDPMMHKFGYWDDHDMSWQRFPSPTVTFPWIAALQDGGKQKFPNDILQFSRQELGLKTNFIDKSSDQYAVYVDLGVLPSGITSLRDGGDIVELPMQDCKVKTSIGNHCGTQLKLVTCLTYQVPNPVGFNNINFHAEHCMPPGMGEINTLFDETRLVQPAFDLKLSCRQLPKASSNNERTLCELGNTLTNNPCSGADCAGPMTTLMIRTANCPQFGITQS